MISSIACPPPQSTELHLGGFTPEEDEATPGGTLLVDTHAAAITQPVWDLYDYALKRFGRQLTIVEWDNDLPPLTTLVGEAARADDGDGACLFVRGGVKCRGFLIFRNLFGTRWFLAASSVSNRCLSGGGIRVSDSRSISVTTAGTLISTLLERFPATVWLLGSPFVTDAAHDFVALGHPPGHASVNMAKSFPNSLLLGQVGQDSISQSVC